MPENAISFKKVTQHWVRVTKGHRPLGAEYNMDSQSKEAQGQGVKKLAKQHLTKKQGVEGGQALRRAQHLTNPSPFLPICLAPPNVASYAKPFRSRTSQSLHSATLVRGGEGRPTHLPSRNFGYCQPFRSYACTFESLPIYTFCDL